MWVEKKRDESILERDLESDLLLYTQVDAVIFCLHTPTNKE